MIGKNVPRRDAERQRRRGGLKGEDFAQKDKKETKGRLESGRSVGIEKHENRFADMKGLEGEESTRMERMPLRGVGWLGEGGDYMKGEKTAARTGTGATGTLPLPGGRRCAGGAPVTGECEEGGLKKASRGGFRGGWSVPFYLVFTNAFFLKSFSVNKALS